MFLKVYDTTEVEILSQPIIHFEELIELGTIGAITKRYVLRCLFDIEAYDDTTLKNFEYLQGVGKISKIIITNDNNETVAKYLKYQTIESVAVPFAPLKPTGSIVFSTTF